MVTQPFVVQALTYDCQCLPCLSTRHKVMGSPPVLDGARQCRPAELDVTLVAFRSSGSEGLSERWMIVEGLDPVPDLLTFLQVIHINIGVMATAIHTSWQELTSTL